MNLRNKFLINLHERISEKTFEERKRIIDKILIDLDKTEILTPVELVDDEDEFDIDFHLERDSDPENIVVLQNEEISKTIKRKQEILGISPFESKTTRFGRTPLHEAVIAGDVSTVNSLLEQKLYIDIKDNNGNTAANLARLEENLEIIEIFKKYGY